MIALIFKEQLTAYAPHRSSAEKHKGREEILASISELIQTSPFKSGK